MSTLNTNSRLKPLELESLRVVIALAGSIATDELDTIVVATNDAKNFLLIFCF